MDGLAGEGLQHPTLKKCEDGLPSLAPNRLPHTASEMGSKGRQQLHRTVRR